MAELLLEIGFEEMPAAWLPQLGEQLAKSFTDLRSEVGLQPEASRDVRVLWSPRRLALGASVVDQQKSSEALVWGPALKVAKDVGGNWTKAAEGFARKNGISPDALESRAKEDSKPEELNLLLVRKVPGRAAGEVLPELIARLLRSLSFPKRMSWDAGIDDGKGALPFGRPIRWLVALLDGAVVPFAIHELVSGQKGALLVQSGRATFGHRFLPRGQGGEPVEVKGFDDLVEKLRERHVVLDPAERSARIEGGLSKARAPRHQIADEWRDLVEWPTVLVGSVPEEFHSLPVEVLETVLVHHQKYVPIPERGTIVRFAAITNTDGAAPESIVAGMQRVVVARLRDAAFFWAEDRKRSLSERVADLSGVTFHRQLGSYREKADRLERIVDKLAEAHLLTDEDAAAARVAAHLCKADLTTSMVRELTELQGVMGALYLEAEGSADLDVAAAIRWHYHPVSVEVGAAPAGLVHGRAALLFSVVSLADRLDTLAGYFSLGLMPTGSSDPFALRRTAQGAVRILMELWPDAYPAPPLRQLVVWACQEHQERAAASMARGQLKKSSSWPGAEVAERLEDWLLPFADDRLRYILASRYPADEVEAVLATSDQTHRTEPREVLLRVEALHLVRSQFPRDFDSLAVAFKRARNILGQSPAAAEVEPGLFDSNAERELHSAVRQLASGSGDYATRLVALRSLRAPVDRFFDDVLVMAEDLKVRGNRLALLQETLGLFYRIADLSRLGGLA